MNISILTTKEAKRLIDTRTTRLVSKMLNAFIQYQKIKKVPVRTIYDHQDVSILPLSTRSANVLNNHNIKTIGDLCSKRRNELLAFRNFGRKSLYEIIEELAAFGRTLKE